MGEPWRDIPDLEGRHIHLRALRADDLADLVQAFATGLEDVFATFVPDDLTVEGWFSDLMREKGAGRAYPFLVLDGDGRVAGTTRYMRMSPKHRRLEIGGTVYAARVQRTGLNTEAKLLLLEHAFGALGCNVVQLRTDWLNARSRTAIERLGAKIDGVLRAHLIMPDGHLRDTIVYSIVASEWPGVRANLHAHMQRHDR